MKLQDYADFRKKQMDKEIQCSDLLRIYLGRSKVIGKEESLGKYRQGIFASAFLDQNTMQRGVL